jgi:catechol 2,3-dioxygenase-like lactoylglutathione lyase family enzyme
MAVSRVVPDFKSRSLEGPRSFYTEVLGLRVVMDHGWIVTLADPQRPDAQLTVMTHDPRAPVVPVASIQVDDGDESYRAARAAEAKVVHERTKSPGSTTLLRTTLCLIPPAGDPSASPVRMVAVSGCWRLSRGD